ncbi:NADP-dependent oxidoreductase domain-containing protein [Flagelloscypha sp. PMI_526]|nr:NADP-dependent oxidoreductase domain-containing protein [Flagelloscypha sp. PMI_526]
MSTYPKRTLGINGPQVSSIGLGAMGMGAFYGSTNEEEALKTLSYAADRGVTFWDTSDKYGTSESIIGKWFSETGRRQDIFLATKWGGNSNSKPSYIKECIKNSLEKLQTNYIDLYYQHRPDPEVPIEIVMATLKPYLEDGTIKYLGVSETSLDDIKRVKAMGGLIAERFIATQSEFSLFERHLEKSGFIEAVEKLGMSIVAYSPLARGLAIGRFRSPDDLESNDSRRNMPRFSQENFDVNIKIVEKLGPIAEKNNATLAQISLGWLLATYPGMILIPGVRSPERLEENAKAAETALSAETLKAIQKVVEDTHVVGERYPPHRIQTCYQNSLPLEQWNGEETVGEA